jgi:hypothetical protein
MPKTSRELGTLLLKRYNVAPKKEKVTSVHLFGIEYPDEILRVGIREVIEESGIPSTYRTELSKGVKLAKYVTLLQLHKT